MSLWLAVAYATFAVVACGTAAKLWRSRRQAFDDRFSGADRRLILVVVFQWVLPVSVLAILLTQRACAVTLGLTLRFERFWVFGASLSFVDGAPAFGAVWSRLAVLALSPLLALGAGLTLWLWTRYWPINAAWNCLRLESARQLIWLHWAIGPLAACVLKEGQAWQACQLLRGVGLGASTAVAMGYALMLAGGWWWWRMRGRRAYGRLATPLFDRLKLLRRGLVRDPDNGFLLRELGRTYLAADAAQQARVALEHASTVRPEHPETRFLAGVAAMRAGTVADAAAHLRAAGRRLQGVPGPTGRQRELLYEVTLGLAAARLELADSEGAVATAEAAQAQRPGEPRSLVLLADALRSLGRSDDARTTLERALRRAEGFLAHEIRRRLRSLSRSS